VQFVVELLLETCISLHPRSALPGSLHRAINSRLIPTDVIVGHATGVAKLTLLSPIVIEPTR